MGRKVISTSYSSAILKLFPHILYIIHFVVKFLGKCNTGFKLKVHIDYKIYPNFTNIRIFKITILKKYNIY